MRHATRVRSRLSNASASGAAPGRPARAWPVAYLATKRALAHDLPLLKRAQDAGVVRPDVEFSDVMHMVIGIAKIPASDPGQIDHILRIALDGLRYRPAPAASD